MKDRAIVLGISGQIGSYMAELLLEKEYDVYGIIRYSTTKKNLDNIRNIKNNINLIEGDVCDSSFLNNTFKTIKPHYIFNFSAQSHVHKSWEIPGQTIEATGTSVLKMLEAIRISGFNSKFFQASTSEMFGKLNNNTELQNEQTTFNPVSIYATAKLMAHNLVKIYRNSYNLFCCSGILFNTESARRGENFVTKKIVKGAAEIFKNERCFLELGNLDAKRDWQHAKDVVEGIYLQMQHNKPKEFVFASGKTHTVQDFVEKVFSKLNLNWQKYIKINSSLFRPTEVDILCGNASDAKNILGWKPKYDLDMIIQEMLDEELKLA